MRRLNEAQPQTPGEPCRSPGDVGAIALLSPEDFEAARHAIAGFTNWSSYEDYLCDREGLAMGLCASGQDTRIVPLSLNSFETWSRLSRSAPSVANLDVFAALMLAFRSNRDREVEGRPVTEARDAEKSTEPGPGPLTVAFPVDSFAAWRACLATVPIFTLPPSPRLYAWLLLEAWSESN